MNCHRPFFLYQHFINYSQDVKKKMIMAKKNLFTQIEFTHLKSNMFDLSHDHKLSCKMGDLIPVYAEEALPGDRWQVGCESLIRFSPLIAPVMHRMDVTIHYFFCPNRLVWLQWENFITGGEDGLQAPAPPYFNVNGDSVGVFPLMGYMGVPQRAGDADIEKINALPFACYQKIYDDYYRDQNLIASDFNPTLGYVGNGDNSAGVSIIAELRKRAWEHDYFTACLPSPQKGAAVSLPLTVPSDVPLLVNTASIPGSDVATVIAGTDMPSSTADTFTINEGTPVGTSVDLFARTSTLTTASTISDLRRAFKLQEFLEKAMRGGARYTEWLLSIFGVKSSDQRLQRPEYIGGVKAPVIVSEVLNTSATATEAQGNMSGHAAGVSSGGYSKYYCEEHGWIIGIMSIMPKTAYQDGIRRSLTKTTDRYDYFIPQFQHIGEQAVKNKELYAFQGAASENTFGYIPRFAEYKFANSRVSGDFRTTLDHWHFGREFGSAPALNQTFIECVPRTDPFAVATGDTLWCHVFNHCKAVRKMAYFGEPRF